MKIGISMRVVSNSVYYELRDAISHDWLTWIQEHDATPVIIPNVSGNGILYEKQPYDLLILSNGNDVIKNTPDSDYSELRNTVESELTAHAISNNIPILGVCRGMQFLNTYFNGSLSPDISSEGAINHIAQSHTVTLAGKIADAYGKKELVTNSYHNQGLFPDGLSPELEPIAICKNDNLVEAFTHRSLPIAGIQWHPERKGESDDFDNWLINRLMTNNMTW